MDNDLKDLSVKILDSKTVEKIYDDTLSASLKEISAITVDFIKATRLLLTGPIQCLATLQDRYRRYLEKVINKVPEERQIKAPAYISGPILEKFKYLEEDNPLTELYMNLLARAIDKERINEAHPAFLNIIEQLSPDEALILYLLRDNVIDPGFSRPICNHEFPKNKLAYPEFLEMYIMHLQSLNLVIWQVGKIRYSSVIVTDFGKLFIKACVPEIVPEL